MDRPASSGQLTDMTGKTPQILRPQRPGEALAITLIAGLGALILAVIDPVFPLDDAYITLHNARSLLAGGTDPVYGGAAATGATSLLHLALVAALGTLLPLTLANHVLTIAAVMLYALGLARLGARHGVNPSLIAALGLASAYLPFSLTNGLETGIAMAAVIWLILLMHSPRLGWLAGLAPFIRPELGLLAALLMACRLWQLRRETAAAAALLGRAVVVALPFLAWSYTMTGDIIPATGGAKVAFFTEIARPLATKLRLAGWPLLLSMLLPLFLGIAGLFRRPGGLVLLAWLLVWMLASLWALPTGFGHNYHRYLAPLVPVLLAGWVMLATDARWRRVLVVVALVSLATGALGVRARIRGDFTGSMVTMAAEARRHIPQGARVVIHDAGYLAWDRPDLKLIDIVGLKSKANIAVHQRLTRTSGNRDAAYLDIISRSNADYLVLLVKDPLWNRMVPVMRDAGWTLDLLTDSPGRKPYGIYRLTPPPAEGA